MTRKTHITLSDDLDEGVPADETISFGFEGRDYEIDLTHEHAQEMRETMTRYISAARKTGRSKTRTRL